MMAKGLAILQFDEMPEGIPPEWCKGPAKALELIPDFAARHQSFKEYLSTGDFDPSKIDAFRLFSGDFFWAWTTSSPVIMKVLGATTVLEILECFAQNRNMYWEPDVLDYLAQLPDRIEIFRGGDGPFEELLKGFSWSLSSDFASNFAEGPDGILARAEIQKKDILLISTLEAEVVPRPSSLKNPQVVRTF